MIRRNLHRRVCWEESGENICSYIYAQTSKNGLSLTTICVSSDSPRAAHADDPSAGAIGHSPEETQSLQHRGIAETTRNWVGQGVEASLRCPEPSTLYLHRVSLHAVDYRCPTLFLNVPRSLRNHCSAVETYKFSSFPVQNRGVVVWRDKACCALLSWPVIGLLLITRGKKGLFVSVSHLRITGKTSS